MYTVCLQLTHLKTNKQKRIGAEYTELIICSEERSYKGRDGSSSPPIIMTLATKKIKRTMYQLSQPAIIGNKNTSTWNNKMVPLFKNHRGRGWARNVVEQLH